MKTTIDLPDSLFGRAMAIAAHRGISLKSLITNGVVSSLNSKSSVWRAVRRDLPRVDKKTLEIIRLRVEESDCDDLMFQQQAEQPKP